MDDRDRASLERCAERIRKRVDRTLIDMESAGAEIGALLSRPHGHEAPRSADLVAVQPILFRLLEEHHAFVRGVGFALDRDHLADTRLWLEWWRHGDGRPAHFVRYRRDPPGEHFDDYTGHGWFTSVHESKRSAVTGSFGDFTGTDEHTITLAAPVRVGEFVDVLGAEVPVERVRRLLIESLRSPAPDVLLLDDQDRVVLSTSSRWFSGTLFHRDPGTRWTGDTPLGGRLRWRLLAGFPD